MEITRTSSDSLILEVSRAEAQIIFGCLIEAQEALSADEFAIRVGEPETSANTLLWELKPKLIEWDDEAREQ